MWMKSRNESAEAKFIIQRIQGWKTVLLSFRKTLIKCLDTWNNKQRWDSQQPWHSFVALHYQAVLLGDVGHLGVSLHTLI